ncbi:glycosyltransferase family 2 protein [Grimontia hollisae]|uniref:Putative glycosyltransferase family 2 protein n=1 Tax=Grimontia hollisae CIP 101886 TaxID=675812 RepID=D0IAR3_GRIHO|nr:glycosyltransferase family 2 protein [Grimontia hollisae]EEY70981.1 putative glycosyltransferase family 2 protein [Grimontia hollisae CIP 101886]STO44415.1 Chondroitin polymerase [Grimontia hollisae]
MINNTLSTPIKFKSVFGWLKSFFKRYFLIFSSYRHENFYLPSQCRKLNQLQLNNNTILFSIIIPTFKPDLTTFKSMFDSVMGQTYQHWQLIIVDDASNCQALSDLLITLNDNPKINIVTQRKNGHISKASNIGLELANGDYLLLLDQDDIIHPDALKCVAYYLGQNPNARVLYSDEDKIDAKGNHHSPHFKPAFNPDLLYSHNYISHLGVYQRELVEKVGGFREGYEGSQDYDLLLRCLEHCKPEEVVHIPYVLYHWRAVPGSTAFAESEKGYAQDAGLRALQDHLGPKGVSVELGKLPNTYRARWPIPAKAPLVSIIIPTRNSRALVERCVTSLYEKNDYPHFEVLLMDNQSDCSESKALFKQLELAGKVRLLMFDAPFNYSAINNMAAKHAKGDVLLLLNNDVEAINPDWLREMVSHAIRPDIGCVGAKLYYPDGRLQHAGVITGLGGVAGHSHKYFPGDHPGYFKRLQIIQNFSAVTGACLAVRKSVFEQVGGLNEKDLAIAFNDVDFCLRVRDSGYRNLWTPYATLIHHESVSRGAENSPEKIARFQREITYMKQKWGDSLLNDPNYSQWLTLDREDFSYR